jgi:3-hydroxybutyryl-CoA dehydrogenase
MERVKMVVKPIGTVGLLGFGVMGAGIAQVASRAGYDVIAVDTDKSILAAGEDRVRESLVVAELRGKLSDKEAELALLRIRPTTSIDTLSSADIVVEAVAEVKEIKLEVLATVGSVVSDDVVVVTNTSALSVTELARAVPLPGRFGGLHFFNPVPAIRLVEIVRALATTDETIDQLAKFVESLGKVSIVVKDRPGFLVNRLLMPYLNDVIQAYDEKLASAEDIDIAVELGLGYPMGPLKLLDLIGLDVHEHATCAAYESCHDPSLAPPPLLQRMVEAGYIGNKANHGFRVGQSGGEA